MLEGKSKKFEMLIDQIRGMVYQRLLDEAHTLVFVSAGCLGLTGYSPAKLIGRAPVDVLDLIHPEDKDIVASAYGQAARCNESFQLVYRIITADHKEKWVRDEGRCLIGENGDALLQGYISDVSDHKQVEFALCSLAVAMAVPASDDFFESCIKHLVQLYGASFGFIGLFAGSDKKRIQTIAVWKDNKPGADFIYDLAGSPCEDCLGRSIELIPERAAELYPQDRALAELGIEAYFGSPLVNSRGETLGIVTVLDVKPMTPNPWTRPVLGNFADRIALELERREVDQALRQTEREYRDIFENVTEGIYRSTPDGRQLRANPALVRLNGYDNEAEMLAAVKDISLEWYVEPGRREEFKHLMTVHGQVTNFVSEIYRHKTRERIWISENAHCVYDDAGSLLYYEGTVLDITARKRAEDALRASESRFRAFIDNAQDVITLLSRAGNVIYVSPSVEKIIGHKPQTLIGLNALELVHPDDLPEVKGEFDKIINGAKYSRWTEFRFRHKNGSWRMIEALGTNCLDDRALSGVVINARDVTERYEAERHIKHLARHDSLTGLPNRMMFSERCHDAILRAVRHRTCFGVLFVDLDRFKPINDSLGHTAGDQLLQAIGKRLTKIVRESDTVARLGGDEFAILVDGINDSQADFQAVALIAQKVIDALRQPFALSNQQLYVSASIGISCYPQDGGDAQTLLQNADIAMYHVKRECRDGFRFFTTGMNAEALDKLLIVNELHRALRHGQFELHYQPRVNLITGNVVGVEALLRWRHPERGLLSPSEFIELAEETGLIESIGDWVLRTACEQVQAWLQQSIKPVRLAVNLSARQFRRAGFAERVAAVLAASKLEAALLELEITESMMMQDPEKTRPTLDELHAMNIDIVIDDFGTGYSSLGYLKRFPVDYLKIDASFIAGIPDKADDVAITKAILAIAKSLGIRTIAEGVQHEAQRDFLRLQGCCEAQGFLFSKPLPAADLAQFLG